MPTQKQAGFSVISLLLFLISLAAIGAVGWYVYIQSTIENPVTSTAKVAEDTSATKEWCDDYEGFCFTYKSDWKLVYIDNTKTYDMTIGAQAVKLTSPNDTSVIYTSGINNAQNGTGNNCIVPDEKDMRAYSQSRKPIADIPNTDYLRFAINEAQKDKETRIALITKGFIPGNTPEGGCATMVTNKEEVDEFNITLMSTFESITHPGQYVIFSSADAIPPVDNADIEAVFASIRYK